MTDVGLAGVGATIALAIATFTSIIWRTESRLDEKYLDRVDDLQSDAWSQTSSELRALFENVEEMADQTDLGDGYQELSRSDRIEFYIQQEIDRGELADIEQSLEDIDAPRRLYEDMVADYDAAVRRLFIALFFVLVVSGALLFPNSEARRVVMGIGGSIILVALISGFDSLTKARKTRKQLDKIWEAYYFD
jgi:hypothetical protein